MHGDVPFLGGESTQLFLNARHFDFAEPCSLAEWAERYVAFAIKRFGFLPTLAYIQVVAAEAYLRADNSVSRQQEVCKALSSAAFPDTR